MGNFEIDFEKLKRKDEAEAAKKALLFWVGAAMFQLFIICICVLIVLFWANKFTLFFLSLMILFLAVIIIMVFTMKKNYQNKLKAVEDEV